jgi:hypothetical protein
MPGYGVVPAEQGSGLLPWAWAEQRLAAAHDYWLATQWPGHPPHVMPVWGVWLDGALWFSSGLRSRKARNLEGDARCTLTTDDAVDPVVVQGAAVRIVEPEPIRAFADALNAKYGTSYDESFFDPNVNGSYRVALTWAFALVQDDFTGSPTRWVFPVTEGPVAIGRPNPPAWPPPPEPPTDAGAEAGAPPPPGTEGRMGAPPPSLPADAPRVAAAPVREAEGERAAEPPPYQPGSAF